MDTLWQALRDRGRIVSRAAAVLVAAVLTLAFGVSATRVGCPEQRYAAQEVPSTLSAQATGHRHTSQVRYLDYRDRSVPLLVW